MLESYARKHSNSPHVIALHVSDLQHGVEPRDEVEHSSDLVSGS